MNLLLDRLPETVKVGGRDYAIRTDYRIGALFELLMQDAGVPPEEKLLRALDLYYPRIPEDLPGAVEALLWFYRCGGQPPGKPGKDDGKAERVYSFDADAPLLYAAFLEQYGIDLCEIPHLHWWKFRALLAALSEDCLFVKVLGYRSARLTDHMTPEQRRFYGRMKALYQLPDGRSEEEKNRSFARAFAGGMNLTR